MEKNDFLEETLSPTKIDEGRQLSSAAESRPGTLMKQFIGPASSQNSISVSRPGTRQ